MHLKNIVFVWLISLLLPLLLQALPQDLEVFFDFEDAEELHGPETEVDRHGEDGHCALKDSSALKYCPRSVQAKIYRNNKYYISYLSSMVGFDTT